MRVGASVFAGSAITGAGVDEPTGRHHRLLPATERDADGRLSGRFSRSSAVPAGEKIAYLRMFTGSLRVRDRVVVGEMPVGSPVLRSVDGHGARRGRNAVTRGQGDRDPGVRAWDLACAGIPSVPGRSPSSGGWVRCRSATASVNASATRPVSPARDAAAHHFAPPTLETVIAADRPAETGALHVALAQLAEQDPLINLRQDDVRQEMFVSLYGEVQKEVIRDTLADEFDLEVSFS
jgi:ribosomal protection tetracycline resistance protein